MNKKEMSDTALKSAYATTNNLKEAREIGEELKNRGYYFKGFAWSKDPDAKDPVEELRKKVLGE